MQNSICPLCTSNCSSEIQHKLDIIKRRERQFIAEALRQILSSNASSAMKLMEMKFIVDLCEAMRRIYFAELT